MYNATSRPNCRNNILIAERNRSLGLKGSNLYGNPLKQYGDRVIAALAVKNTKYELPPHTRTTFITAFSPDNSLLASCHGDHNIHILDVKSKKLVKSLSGHERSPWCVTFHPGSNEILATGSLNGEVRVWDLRGDGSESWTVVSSDNNELPAIASLSFHPYDHVLAIAAGNEIHFWDWSRPDPFASVKTNLESEKVRFVRFDPWGHSIITGVVNSSDDEDEETTFDHWSWLFAPSSRAWRSGETRTSSRPRSRRRNHGGSAREPEQSLEDADSNQSSRSRRVRDRRLFNAWRASRRIGNRVASDRGRTENPPDNDEYSSTLQPSTVSRRGAISEDFEGTNDSSRNPLSETHERILHARVSVNAEIQHQYTRLQMLRQERHRLELRLRELQNSANEVRNSTPMLSNDNLTSTNPQNTTQLQITAPYTRSITNSVRERRRRLLESLNMRRRVIGNRATTERMNTQTSTTVTQPCELSESARSRRRRRRLALRPESMENVTPSVSSSWQPMLANDVLTNSISSSFSVGQRAGLESSEYTTPRIAPYVSFPMMGNGEWPNPTPTINYNERRQRLQNELREPRYRPSASTLLSPYTNLGTNASDLWDVAVEDLPGTDTQRHNQASYPPGVHSDLFDLMEIDVPNVDTSVTLASSNHADHFMDFNNPLAPNEQAFNNSPPGNIQMPLQSNNEHLLNPNSTGSLSSVLDSELTILANAASEANSLDPVLSSSSLHQEPVSTSLNLQEPVSTGSNLLELDTVSEHESRQMMSRLFQRQNHPGSNRIELVLPNSELNSSFSNRLATPASGESAMNAGRSQMPVQDGNITSMSSNFASTTPAPCPTRSRQPPVDYNMNRFGPLSYPLAPTSSRNFLFDDMNMDSRLSSVTSLSTAVDSLIEATDSLSAAADNLLRDTVNSATNYMANDDSSNRNRHFDNSQNENIQSSNNQGATTNISTPGHIDIPGRPRQAHRLPVTHRYDFDLINELPLPSIATRASISQNVSGVPRSTTSNAPRSHSMNGMASSTSSIYGMSSSTTSSNTPSAPTAYGMSPSTPMMNTPSTPSMYEMSSSTTMLNTLSAPNSTVPSMFGISSSPPMSNTPSVPSMYGISSSPPMSNTPSSPSMYGMTSSTPMSNTPSAPSVYGSIEDVPNTPEDHINLVSSLGPSRLVRPDEMAEFSIGLEPTIMSHQDAEVEEERDWVVNDWRRTSQQSQTASRSQPQSSFVPEPTSRENFVPMDRGTFRNYETSPNSDFSRPNVRPTFPIPSLRREPRSQRQTRRMRTSMRSNINRIISTVYAENHGHRAVILNIDNTSYRLQYWDFTKLKLPEISRSDINVLVPHCKIYNDASVDISQDGRLLATFVPTFVGCPDSMMNVGIFSLEKSNFGDLLYKKSYGPNAVCLSISPLSNYICVGLKSRQFIIGDSSLSKRVMAEILELTNENKPEMPVRRQVFHETSNTSHRPVSINTISWSPEIGGGLVYGTNNGELRMCNLDSKRLKIEEESYECETDS